MIHAILLLAASAWAQQEPIRTQVVEDSDTLTALQQSVDDKFSVRGGTVSGPTQFAGAVTGSGAATWNGTSTMNGATSVLAGLTVQSGGSDITLSTSNVGAPTMKISGTDGSVTVASATVLSGLTSAPAGVSSAGVIYYDKSAQTLKVINNAGTPTAIPDPPGSWTCTLRTGTAVLGNTIAGSATATCSGNEKIISGGCKWQTAPANTSTFYISGTVTNQGYSCFGINNTGGAGNTLEADANCCL